MSAWDIAGAVGWAALVVCSFNSSAKSRMIADAEGWRVVAAVALGFDTFCIARLFGARL